MSAPEAPRRRSDESPALSATMETVPFVAMQAGTLSARTYGDTKAVRSWSDHLSARGILAVSLVTMGLFYSLQFVRRPRRALRTIVNLVRREPVTWLERTLLGRTRRRRYRRAPARPLLQEHAL
jgi:hypothetical protein